MEVTEQSIWFNGEIEALIKEQIENYDMSICISSWNFMYVLEKLKHTQKFEHTSMKLWNCVNILNMSLPTEMCPLNRWFQKYNLWSNCLYNYWYTNNKKQYQMNQIYYGKNSYTKIGQSVHVDNEQLLVGLESQE